MQSWMPLKTMKKKVNKKEVKYKGYSNACSGCIFNERTKGYLEGGCAYTRVVREIKKDSSISCHAGYIWIKKDCLQNIVLDAARDAVQQE